VSNDSFIDIHCHILPGVDDGSRDMNSSLQMARVAVKNQIGEIIVTPHYTSAHRSVSADGVRGRVQELQAVCHAEKLDLKFYPGNELLYDSSLPDKLSQGEVLTLADSKYCLIEFFPMDNFQYIQEGLRAVRYAGFRPILAHCERYVCMVEHPDYAERLVDQEVLLQCNSASVLPKLFQPLPKFVKGLLSKGLVSFIATDAHRPEGNRAPDILRTATWLRKKYGETYSGALLYGNARRIIQGDTL